MRKIEVSAKTVEQAIEKGLQMLGTARENVEVVVLEKETMLKKAKIEMVIFATPEERVSFNEEQKQQNSAKNKKSTNNFSGAQNSSHSHSSNKRSNIKVNINKLDTTPVVEREELTETETEISSKVINLLTEFFTFYNKVGVFATVAQDDDLCIKITGDGMGSLIGHHGDNLEAVQNIVNTIVKNKFEDYRKKVFIDIENYREKRKQSLEGLAKRMATKVLTVKKSLKLEAMNSFERRIIHFALQGIENISTYSEGNEPNRYLVIEYVK